VITAGAGRGREGRARGVELEFTAVRAAGLVRVVIATVTSAVGVAGAGRWEGSMALLFLAVGLIWLPWSVFLLATGSGRERTRLAVYGGPLGDVLIVFAAQCLVPWAWGILMLADALAVSLAASLWRPRDASLLLCWSVGLTVLAQSIVSPPDRVAVGLVVVFAVAMAGLVVVVGRIARDHRLAAVNSHRFQQKAETILARVADGIVVTDGKGEVLETNPAGERLIGAEGWPAIGLPCARALGLHEGERPLDCRSGCPLLSGETADAGLGREVWRLLPDGRRQPLLANAFSVADDRGGVEVVHSLRDITRLKEADEAKTLFLATASHELKTPVTVIAGFAETILRYPTMPPERRAEAVEAIRRRALELSSIVDRLLLSSKIEGGRVTVDIHPVDVRALLVERGNAFQDGSGRHVVLQVAHEALVAQADPLAMRTVVDHLLDNAAKYSDGGPVVLAGRRKGGAVEVSVSDIGIGMDEEQARHCFDKFWQAESTDVRRFGGTGIGLYIVSSMVDAMGGTITVETAVAQGSRFTVSLPAVVAEEPVDDERDGLDDQSGIKDLMRQIGVLTRGSA
jgi:PAS domain S-box-containing protein